MKKTTTLGGYIVPSKTVEIDDEASVTVRGLSVSDLVEIVDNYLAEVTAIYNEYLAEKEKTERVSLDWVRAMFETYIRQSPDLLYAVILKGAEEDGSPEAIANLRKIPIIAQYDLIEAVLLLTIRSEVELGKFFGALSTRIVQITGLVQTVDAGMRARLNLPPASFGQPDKV